jgi:hypothetical protein
MPKYESYHAKADADKAMALANTPSPFNIEVRFIGSGLTPAQKNAFKRAADRWSRVIVGDLPSVVIDGELIDDILILAEGASIDGPGHVLGQAGPTVLRPASAGASAFLPAKGEMTFDTADLAQMEANGTLNDVIAHEMGHVLGIGTVWTHKKLLKNPHTTNPTFIGTGAMAEYGKLKGTAATPVPVENTGGQGTADSHWRETVFGKELMTGFVGASGNPLSRMTAASLADLGYKIDVTAAEPYTLPNHLHMAEAALAAAPAVEGIMLGFVPTVAPEDSLQ